MASIGKPMKLRPQLDFEAKYQPFGHSMAVFLTSMGAEKRPKMVRIGLKGGTGGIGLHADWVRGRGHDCGETFK